MSTPKEVHEVEQGLAALAFMAAHCATFYRSLVQEGMPESVATALTAKYLESMLKRALGGKPESEEG